MRELAFLTTTLTVILAVIIAASMVNGGPAGDDPLAANTEYEWQVYDSRVLNESNTNALRLTFTDGRIYEWRIASISTIQVFPPKWSEGMGYGRTKTLLIQCGGVKTFLPVSGSDAAEALFDMLIEDAEPTKDK